MITQVDYEDILNSYFTLVTFESRNSPCDAFVSPIKSPFCPFTLRKQWKEHLNRQSTPKFLLDLWSLFAFVLSRQWKKINHRKAHLTIDLSVFFPGEITANDRPRLTPGLAWPGLALRQSGSGWNWKRFTDWSSFSFQKFQEQELNWWIEFRDLFSNCLCAEINCLSLHITCTMRKCVLDQQHLPHFQLPNSVRCICEVFLFWLSKRIWTLFVVVTLTFFLSVLADSSHFRNLQIPPPPPLRCAICGTERGREGDGCWVDVLICVHFVSAMAGDSANSARCP